MEFYKNIPFEQKVRIYKKALKLIGKNLSTRRIQAAILTKFKVVVNEETIRVWRRHKHSPFGNVKLLKNEPISLAYVIGATLSDGSPYYDKKRGAYQVYLISADKEFLGEFENCCKRLGLSVTRTHYGRYPVRVAKNRELYYFVTQRWKNFIAKNNKKVLSAFLKGFFDGDGNALFPGFVNTNLNLLRLVRKLLNKLHIKSSPPILTVWKGRKFFYPDKNAQPTSIKNCYTIFIHPHDYEKFLEKIGTSIKRKEYLIHLSMERLKQEELPTTGWWKVCEKLARSIGCKMKKRISSKFSRKS